MKDCTHDDAYGITSMDGINCFLCNEQLNIDQSIVLEALALKKKAMILYKKHMKLCNLADCSNPLHTLIEK
jgi:hypothetical protein